VKKNVFERQRELQAEQPKAAESPYQRLYGLRENPFPSQALFVAAANADPRKNGAIYDTELRRDEEEKFFHRFVLPQNGDSPLPLGFLRLDPQAGGRGNGKSTFLHRIMTRLNASDWTGLADPDDPRLSVLAVHLLPQPKEHGSFFQLVRLMFETLDKAKVSASGHRRLIRKVDGEIRAALLLDLLEEDQIKALSERQEVTEDLESRERFAGVLAEFGLTEEGLAEAAQVRLENISSTCLDNDFTRGFLEHGASLEALWATWRRNGWVASDYRWKRSGADWLTNGLVPALVLAGYRRLYVLLDEFEKIYIYQTSRKREEFLDLLRQVFYEQDSAAVRWQFFVTVLSIHPSIETYLKEHWTRVGLDQLAPLSREGIDQISVALGKSTTKRLNHLIVTYLDHYRPEDDPQHGEMYPFAPGALDEAFEAARLYPRGALRYAHFILSKAASDNIPAPIPKRYVKEFFEAHAGPEDDDDVDATEGASINLTED
jgi:hypothetical protein